MSSTTAQSPDASPTLPVPRIGFYDGTGVPEDYPLPAVFRALLAYQRKDLGYGGRDAAFDEGWQWGACALFFGVSGQGFRLAWDPEDLDRTYLGADLMRMYADCFEAAGYAYEALLKPEFAAGLALGPQCVVSDDEAAYRDRIRESIRARRMPVISLGLFGPPEPGLIAGCDEDGAALIGWDHFQGGAEGDPRVSTEPSGMYRKRDWFGDIQGILVVTGERDRPDAARMHREALKRCLRDLAALERGGRPVGLGVYGAWTRALLDDGSHANAEAAVLRKRYDCQHGIVGDIAQRRAYAATYMILAAEALPDASEDLRQAGVCFEIMHDLCWRAWQTVGTGHIKTEEAPSRFARPEVRRELAALALLHRDLDARAAGHMARALRTLGEDPADIADVPQLARRDAFEGVRSIPYFASGLEAPLQSDALDPGADAYADGKRLRGPHLLTGDMEADALAAREAGLRLRVEAFAPGDATRREQLTTDAVLSVYRGLPASIGCGDGSAVIVGFHIWSMQFLIATGASDGRDLTRVSHRDPAISGPFMFLDPPM